MLDSSDFYQNIHFLPYILCFECSTIDQTFPTAEEQNKKTLKEGVKN